MGVRVDKRSCQSSGNCVAAEPTAFAFDDDGLAEALPPADALPQERLLAVAGRCPALAISVDDTEGGG